MKILANDDVRAAMKRSKVTLWQIADVLCVCEMTVTRRFRHEMNAAAKAAMIELIARIAEEKQGGNVCGI